MQHKYERLSEEIERKKNDYEQSKGMYDKEKKQLTEKLESTKKKLAEIQDETMKQRLDFGREQALSKQQVKSQFLIILQIEFQNKKIEELQKQIDDSQRFFDEKISKYCPIIPQLLSSLAFVVCVGLGPPITLGVCFKLHSNK